MSMSAEMITSLSAIVVSLVTTGGVVWVARSARRTPRQDSRDDFLAVTESQSKAIDQLEVRIQAREQEAERQRQRIGDQDAAIGWLLGRVRVLVSYIRTAGLEPPAPAQVPKRVRDYLHHIDV